MKNKTLDVGNKFLALMLLNSLMRTQDKPFLECFDKYFLDRLRKIAKDNKNFDGLQEFSNKPLNKSREAHKFYYLLA